MAGENILGGTYQPLVAKGGSGLGCLASPGEASGHPAEGLAWCARCTPTSLTPPFLSFPVVSLGHRELQPGVKAVQVVLR